jgi:nucleoside-diphosphate-sugar epimerase
MEIVVTGANGLIGRRVVLLALQQGHTVRGLDSSSTSKPVPPADAAADAYVQSHPQYTSTDIDLRDYDETLRALKGAEAVVHLAGIPQPNINVVEAHNTNVVLSFNVLRAAAELGIARVAAASSVNALGLVYNQTRQFDYLPVDEAHPCRPDEPYGLSKLFVHTCLFLSVSLAF